MPGFAGETVEAIRALDEHWDGQVIGRIRRGCSGQQNGPLSDLGRAGQPIHAEPRLIAVKRQLGLVD
jgi:hypothetical protein